MRKMLRRRKMTRLVKGYDFPWMPSGKLGDDLISEAISLVESVGSRLDLRRAAEDDLEGIIASSTPEARWAAVEDELVMRYATDDGSTIRTNLATVLAESDDDQHTLAMTAKNGLSDNPPRTAINWLLLIVKVLRVLFDMLDDALNGPTRAHILDSDVDDEPIDAEFVVIRPPAPESEVEPSVPDDVPTNNQVWGGGTEA